MATHVNILLPRLQTDVHRNVKLLPHTSKTNDANGSERRKFCTETCWNNTSSECFMKPLEAPNPKEGKLSSRNAIRSGRISSPPSHHSTYTVCSNKPKEVVAIKVMEINIQEIKQCRQHVHHLTTAL